MRETRLTIEQSPFGTHAGKPVTAYRLSNANGLCASLIDFGARLTQMVVPDKAGTPADIVLGFDDLAAYAATDTYFGATCGRYGNRIAGGRFMLDGTTVQVTVNEGPNHLHGGRVGFDKHVWDAQPDEARNAVTFSLASPNGDEGFPGTLKLQSTYQLTDDDRLLITMTGTSDKPTILNMVHHSYWNTAGDASGDVCGQLLTVHGDFYTPVDEQLLATGEILGVVDTPFDFRTEKAIGQDIGSIANAGFGRLSGEGGGYDHNWVLNGFGPGLRPVATLRDPVSGRGFTLASTEPGVQIYTGGYLSAAVTGKGSKPYCKYAGVTFETQKFPGSPTFAHFPSTRLDPGDTYQHRMELRFFAR